MLEGCVNLYDKALGVVPKRLFETVHSRAPHLRLRDVTAYRDYLIRHGPRVDVPELTKDNAKATEARLEGNRLFHRKLFSHALEKYNESVCLAKQDSKELGMGYANCSAILFTAEEYEHTLLAIALAKQHHYPERLMPKLLTRESECRRMIAAGQSRCRPDKASPFKLNVIGNPKIPFLADGITMRTLPGYGRSLVAEREFKAGDVILEEELTACSLNSAKKYLLCQFCTYILDQSPVPCPECGSVVYCSERCRTEDKAVVHRYECGIVEKLDHISYGAARIGVRMFLRGLHLFDDSVDKMMEFCKAHNRSGSNPLSLDYSLKRDSMQEFKVFHQTVVPDIDLKTDRTRIQAALYYSILINHPPIGALLLNDGHKDFMLRCIHDYVRTALFLASYQSNLETNKLYTVAAVCNHACIPNTFAATSDGRLVFIVLRPIRPNEQILTSYNIMHVEGDMGHENPYAWKLAVQFKCICPICRPVGSRVAHLSTPPPIAPPDHDALRHALHEAKNPEEDLVIMRQFMQRYGHLHPDYPMFDQYVRKYREYLMMVFLYYIDNAHRVEAGVEAQRHA